MKVRAVFSKLDLHSHTTASDGILTPRQLVAVALERKLRVLAITDHESTEGLAEALEASAGTPLEVWPGVEISTDVPGDEVHILGYLMDYPDEAFQTMLRLLRESRMSRAQRMVAKLAELGMALAWERVQEIAGAGSIGRPHVAQALVERGYVFDVAEAFRRYIGRNGPAYVERFRLAPEEAVRLIVAAKGLAVLAHPVMVGDGAQRSLDLDKMLPGLCAAGLAGMEIYYPGYASDIRARLSHLIKRWDLVGTGGSDYHGRGTLIVGLGDIAVPERVIDLVRERHQRQARMTESEKKRTA